MERAAELLRSGRYNVTEAATEVGYSSLSHFSKAFCETIGCCPVLVSDGEARRSRSLNRLRSSTDESVRVPGIRFGLCQ